MSHKNYYRNDETKETVGFDEEIDLMDAMELALEETAEAEKEETENLITVEKKESLVGVVKDCEKLNIRKAPDKKSEAVCIVMVGSVLLIDQDKSTDDWYKVYTESGMEGFCMKKYVVTSE